MQNIDRKILISSLIVFLSCLLILVVSCQRGERENATIGATDVPDQQFSNFTTVESDSGIVRWRLVAPVARLYNARKLLAADKPRVEFYDKSGILTSILTAEKGEYNQVTHDLTALGKVVVTSQEGYVLETESLVWVNGLSEMHSEDFVTFTRGNDVLTGYGLRGDPELHNVEILRDVKAYLRDEKGLLRQEMEKDASPGGR